MSALTENPERVRKLFVNENITPEGIYGLNVTKSFNIISEINDTTKLIKIKV